MRKIFLGLSFFYSLHGNAQEAIYVNDAVHKAGFSMDFYLTGKILFTVYKNGKSICTDGNVKIWVDFQERYANGKRETFESFNQEKFNCKGLYSFSLTADSSDLDTSLFSINYLFNRYKMLTTKKVYAIVFEPYQGNTEDPPVRVNVDANSALQISRAVKKYIKL